MRRVIQYIQKFSPAHWGGAEEAILQCAKALRVHGFESQVWATRIFSNVSEEDVDGVTVRRFPAFFISKNEADQAGSGKAPLSGLLIRDLWADDSVDLLHVHGHNRMASMMVAAARLKRTPVVLTLHSAFLPLRPRWRYWFQNEYGIRRASRVVTVNQAIRDSLAAAGVVDAGRTVVIPNGVNVESFAAGDGLRFRHSIGIADEPLVITVGRICKAKNQKAVLQILPLVNEILSKVHWAIIGFPSDEAYYRDLLKGIDKQHLRDVVHVIPGLAPRSEQLVDAYAAADAFVLPSEHEASPLVVFEAWAAGTPIVANGVAGLDDLILHGSTGLLVEPHDVQALAAAIISVVTNQTVRSELIDRGLQRAYTYDWNRLAAKVASVYEDIL